MTERLAVRLRFANWLMHVAYRAVERIDRRAVPKYTGFSFKFVQGVGVVFNDGLRAENDGCPIWYLNDADYEKARY